MTKFLIITYAQVINFILENFELAQALGKDIKSDINSYLSEMSSFYPYL